MAEARIGQQDAGDPLSEFARVAQRELLVAHLHPAESCLVFANAHEGEGDRIRNQ